MVEVWPTTHVTELRLTAGSGPWSGYEHRPTDTELWESAVDYGSFTFTYLQVSLLIYVCSTYSCIWQVALVNQHVMVMTMTIISDWNWWRWSLVSGTWVRLRLSTRTRLRVQFLVSWIQRSSLRRHSISPIIAMSQLLYDPPTRLLMASQSYSRICRWVGSVFMRDSRMLRAS